MCDVAYRAASSERLNDAGTAGDTQRSNPGVSEIAPENRKARRVTRVRTPVQKRSKATYEKILAVSAELVVDHGLEGFTTNAVAEKADVNIATVYSYFPDKLAILEKLVVRTEQLRTNRLAAQLADKSPASWRVRLSQALEALVEFRLHHPSGKALRNVAQATPELRHLHDESIGRAAVIVAKALQDHNRTLSDQHAQRICEVVIRSATSVLDEATDNGARDDALISELFHMLTTYLSRYLDVETATA